LIDVYLDSNEKNADRSNRLILTIARDDRFHFAGFRDQYVDLIYERGDRRFVVELKTPQDFVSSVLSGHLFSQVLSIREHGDPGIVAVLGTDVEIEKSIVRSCSARPSGGFKKPPKELIKSYSDSVRHFESASFAVGVPVLHMDRSPFRRISSIAHKVLDSENAEFMAHKPRPADNERQVAALCVLVPGVGPEKARALLEKFSLRELSMATAEDVKIVKGIGDVLAGRIVEAFNFRRC